MVVTVVVVVVTVVVTVVGVVLTVVVLTKLGSEVIGTFDLDLVKLCLLFEMTNLDSGTRDFDSIL